MNWLLWLKETTLGCADNLFQMIIIIIPLMIGMEFIKEYKLLEKISPALSPVTNFVGLPAQAVLPILAGLFFGIIYGAGLIIQSGRDGTLTHKQMTLVCCFLVMCHSMVEDHALFAAQGANAILLLALRLVLAVLVTWLINRLWREKNEPVTEKDIAYLQAIDGCHHD